MSDQPKPITFRDDEGRPLKLLVDWDLDTVIRAARDATPDDLERAGYVERFAQETRDKIQDASLRMLERQSKELEALRALERHIRRFIAPRMGQERKWAPSMDGVTGDLLKAIDEAREK